MYTPPPPPAPAPTTTTTTSTASVFFVSHMVRVLGALQRLLLGDDFAGVKLNEHGAVRVELFDGYGEAEVVEEEKLELEMVEFD